MVFWGFIRGRPGQAANQPEIFGLGEVARIIGAPPSRVKDWTIGRPLLIAPSVLAASGTGTRNLYSREDVYWMAMLKQLGEAGLATEVLSDVLRVRESEEQRGGQPFLRHVTALKITGRGGRLASVRWWTGDDPTPFFSRFPPGPPGEYMLDLRPLWKRVDRRIAKLRKRRKRGKYRA